MFQHHKEEAIALLDAWRRREEISQLALTPSTAMDNPSGMEETIELLHLLEKLHFFPESALPEDIVGWEVKSWIGERAEKWVRAYSRGIS